MAIGFSRPRIFKMFITEGAIIASIGGVIGALLAIPMSYLVIQRISSVWSGTVNSMAIEAHVSPINLVMGAVVAVVLAVISLW